jgi:transcriptional regulator GlxA family with amidase domain
MQWLAAVEFRPAGVGHFSGFPASEACNRVVSTDAIWGSAGATLRERLIEAPTPQARFAVFEELLLQQLDHAFDPAIAWAIGALQRGMRVSEVASRLGLLPRTFERRFSGRVGLSPKRYARVRRLQRVLKSLRSGTPVDWSRLAAGHGYHDQSHLVHEFRQLADISPSGYKRHSAGRNNHIPIAPL